MISSRLLAGLGLMAWVGCDGGGAIGDPPRHPVPGCEAIDHAPCDVRAATCQTRLLALAVCLRGDEPAVMPAVSLMTQTEYAAYLNERLAARDPLPDPNHYERALTLLGLVQAGAFSRETYVAENVAFVWGVYRWDTKDIVIIDHGDAFDDASASPVLVHEFIHALQDRDVDLESFHGRATSYDSSLAADAVVEGEALLHQTRYGASVLGLDPAEIDWAKRFQSRVDVEEPTLAKKPSPYTASWSLFPYQWGGRYMHFTWAAGGLQAVRGRFASPPTTTRTLMASVDRALDPDQAPVPPLAPAAPADWSLFGSAELGAWGVFLFLERPIALDVDRARALALGWRGDEVWAYAAAATSPAPGTTAVVWRIDFADETTAGGVASIAAGVVGATGAVRQQGTRLVVARTNGTMPIDWAFGP